MFLEENNLPNKTELSEPVLNQENPTPSAPKYALWKRGVLAAIGTIGLYIVSLFALVFVLFIPKSDQDAALMLIVYSLLFMAMAGFCFIDIKKFIHIFKGWKPYVFGLAFGIAMILLDMAYTNFVNLFYSLDTGGNEESVRSVIDLYPVASIFIIGIVGPLIEELTYRIGIFGLLRRVNIVLAYVVASLIFGFMHFDFTSGNIVLEFILLPTYVLSGTIFCLAYDLFGLPCSWTAHVTNNLFSVIVHIILANLE